MVKQIITDNYATVVLMLLMFTVTIIDKSFPRRVNRMFMTYTLIVLALSFSVSVEAYLGTLEQPSFLRYIMSALGYTLRPLTLYLVLCIIARKNRKINLIYSIPAIINAIISFLSIFTRWVFLFTDGNCFKRGPLWFFPFVVSMVYMLGILIVSYREFYHDNLGEFKIIVALWALGVIGTYFEVVYNYQHLLCETMAIALYFYYLYLHIKIYKRDQLTGLLNRRSFYLDFNKWNDTNLGVVSFDLNNLKILNDTEGHASGDLALVTFVNIVKNNVPSKCGFYRTGGDEFMLLCPRATIRQMDLLGDKVKKDLEKTKYSAAFGCAVYRPGMNFEYVCALADEKMYKDKAEFKRIA